MKCIPRVWGGVLLSTLVACSPSVPDEEADRRVDGAGGSPSSGGADGKAPAVSTGGLASDAPTATPWPEGKQAAVSLTYDDGLDSQLKYALPALEQRGFRATFFLASFPGLENEWSLPDLTTALSPRHEAWAAVAASGHELGGHTIHHPCESNGAGFQPSNYNAKKMAAELDESSLRLERLGAEAPFTFAYPCGGDVSGISDGSYMPLVNERYLAARTSSEGVTQAGNANLFDVAQRFGASEKTSSKDLIAYVDEALAQGGWAVFTFHGIGPDDVSCDIGEFDLEQCALSYLGTEKAEHEALLDYLVAREKDVWTAPLKTVALHLAD